MRSFIRQSFQRKLLLFVLLAVFLTTLLQLAYLINNFRQITDLALAENKRGAEQTADEFMAKYADEKAAAISEQLRAAQNNLSVLGRTAQKLVDNYAVIRENPALLNLALFRTELEERNGALGAPTDAPFDALIPPHLLDDPRAHEVLASSALLNLSMDAVYDANPNNTLIYFVGDETSPVTRAYPNRDLATELGEAVVLDFWRDFFPGTVEQWTRYYTDAELRARLPSPITVVGPYKDAAGQGLVMTMFYPLWDSQAGRFAGAVGADIQLASIIENILAFRLGESGFAFLIDSAGRVVAMPDIGFELFKIELTEVEIGGLTYINSTLADSDSADVQALAALLEGNQSGQMTLDLTREGQVAGREIVAFASLDPLSDSNYAADSWKVIIAVPEDEIFAALNATDATIRRESLNMSLISLGIVLGSLGLVSLVAVRFSRSATRDLRILAGAARGVADKRYDVEVNLTSQDEIGQLGRAFSAMTREIREYTVNLEAKVAERTADLKRAHDEIALLNDQLRGENLRLGAELDVARRLQMMVLPPEHETRAVSELDIACYMRPADEVGGDYYDVLQVGDCIYLGIGDVTGHGLPAGIIMLMAQTAFMTLSQTGERDMERIVDLMNRVLFRNIVRIQEDKNMTLAVLQYRQRELAVVGQHESVLICRANGEVEVIDTMDLGLPMGLEEDIGEFVGTRRLRLEPGDVLLLYTDGVTEAENAAGQQFGVDNLIHSLTEYHELGAEEIKSRIMADVYAFIGEARIYDDISLLVVKQR